MFFFFITKSRKGETTKNNSENFVFFGVRVFVIHFYPENPACLVKPDLSFVSPGYNKVKS